MTTHLNVFSGEHALRDLMNPGKQPYLPLVEVPGALNPFSGDRVRIFAKLMTFTTLHNVKAIPGFNMVAAAHERGELGGVHTAVENSSGNTVSAIAVAARLFGIETTKAIVPEEISRQKLRLLRFFGITPIVNREPDDPGPEDPTSGIYRAREMGRQDGWFNPGQYHNPDNPEAHRKWIGPQIWEQTGGEVGVFCGALGTTGTIIGNSEYLKGKRDSVQVVGVMRAPGSYIPGPRTEARLRLVGLEWRPHVDAVTEAATPDSYATSLRLSRQGLFVGPSSGLALVGLLDYLDKRKSAGTLDELRNAEGDVVCVFVCPDTPIPYFDEYFRYVDESNFPQIVNEELLLGEG
jgi:cysteine synthase